MTAVVLRGDARALPLPDASVDLVVCSPPYFGLRSYTDGGEHYEGQIGSEATPAEWLASLLDATREWVRVLKPSGSIFVNLGDKYVHDGITKVRGEAEKKNYGGWSMARNGPAAREDGDHRKAFSGNDVHIGTDTTGLPPKSLLGLPWRYALACTDQLGLILRRDIIWSKPNGLPESVTDRCRSSHEYLFHMVRQPRYYAAVDEIREAHNRSEGVAPPGRGAWKAGARPPGVRAKIPMSGGGEDAYNPLGKLPGSVWSIPSQPLTVPAHLGVDHFAAFPMELPRRCILGWSPPGICTACGEGRHPVVTGGRNGDGSKPHKAAMRVASFDWAAWKEGEPHRITGYACACPAPTAPTRPAVVLDPFGGTGTTALVASVLGRTGVSIDRSADYCRLARWRTADPAERARAMQVPKPPPVPAGQVSLFDLDAS